MGKRSNFERMARDAYATPLSAVLPLLPHLQPHTRFVEPCAGTGQLVQYLELHDHECIRAFDIAPATTGIGIGDALVERMNFPDAWCITNPPWSRDILHPLIEHWCAQMPTWLLFDADWAHTKQAAPYLQHCRKIVSVGRVKWIENSPYTGKDNCAWYLFTRESGNTIFFGR